jgi:hypothetical protein
MNEVVSSRPNSDVEPLLDTVVGPKDEEGLPAESATIV